MKKLFLVSLVLGMAGCGLDGSQFPMEMSPPAIEAQGLFRPSATLWPSYPYWTLRLSKDKLLRQPVERSIFEVVHPQGFVGQFYMGEDGGLYAAALGENGRAFLVGRYEKPARFDKDVPVRFTLNPGYRLKFDKGVNFLGESDHVDLEVAPDIRPVPLPPFIKMSLR